MTGIIRCDGKVLREGPLATDRAFPVIGDTTVIDGIEYRVVKRTWLPVPEDKVIFDCLPELTP